MECDIDPLVPVTFAVQIPLEGALKVSSVEAVPPTDKVTDVGLREPVDPWGIVRVSETVPANCPSPVIATENVAFWLGPTCLEPIGVVMLKSAIEIATMEKCARIPLVAVTLAV